MPDKKEYYLGGSTTTKRRVKEGHGMDSETVFEMMNSIH